MIDPDAITALILAGGRGRRMGGNDKGLHPYDGETKFNYDGPEPPYEHLDVEKSYSWLKSPRWKGNAMEVGPLARVLMLYATGHEQTQELVNYTLSTLNVPVDALFSTLGRTAARTLETKVVADTLHHTVKPGDTLCIVEAMKLMNEAALENDHVLAEPPVSIIFDAFGDNALNLVLRCFVDSADLLFVVASELNEAINEKFKAAGITIAFPQRDVHMNTLSPLEVRVLEAGKPSKGAGK